MLIVLCWILAAWSIVWGFDSEEWSKTINFNWRHYDPIGHASFSLRTDNEFHYLKSFGLGHYFDSIGTGLHLTGNRRFETDSYEFGYSLTKDFLDGDYSLHLRYEPLWNEFIYGLNAKITNGLYVRLSYSDYRKNLDISGSYRVSDTTNLFVSSSESETGRSYYTGLNVSFQSGSHVPRRKKRERPIIWQ